MDLIYMDETFTELGVIRDSTLDEAFGAGENSFDITVNINNNVLLPGYYFYIDNTEYGGIVDAISVNTAASEIHYTGRSWHGILASKIIIPPSGEAYRTVSGEANAVMGSLLTLCGLDDLFAASTDISDYTILSYSFVRYIDLYNGLIAMLQSATARLDIQYDADISKVILSAQTITDYSSDDEFSSDLADFVIQKTYHGVNHLICLGSGELATRQVVNLYVDNSGNISDTQYYTGLDEVIAIFDSPNAESIEDLTAEGTKELETLYAPDKIEITVNDGTDYKIGDIVGGREEITGLFASDKITKKIIKIADDIITISYKVGESK